MSAVFGLATPSGRSRRKSRELLHRCSRRRCSFRQPFSRAVSGQAHHACFCSFSRQSTPGDCACFPNAWETVDPVNNLYWGAAGGVKKSGIRARTSGPNQMRDSLLPKTAHPPLRHTNFENEDMWKNVPQLVRAPVDQAGCEFRELLILSESGTPKILNSTSCSQW